MNWTYIRGFLAGAFFAFTAMLALVGIKDILTEARKNQDEQTHEI